MKLYLVTAESPEDFLNLDLMVQAAGPCTAFNIWRKHWLEEEQVDDSQYSGAMIEYSVGSLPKTENTARVFEISTNENVQGVLSWISNPVEFNPAGSCILRGFVEA